MPSKDARSPLEIVREFARKAETVRNDVLVGIDPGMTGAIAFRCRKFYCVVSIPVTVTKVKKTRRTTGQQRKATGKKTRVVVSEHKEFDLSTICEMFKALRPVRDRVRVMLENIPLSLGPGRKYAEIMLNRAYMLWPLFLQAKGYAVYLERPSVWKPRMGLAGAEKEASRKKALAMFPRADIVRKKDHDRAEALLLVEYLRRLLAGEFKDKR